MPRFEPSIPAATMQSPPPADETHYVETERPDLTPKQRRRLQLAHRLRNAYTKTAQAQRSAIRNRRSHYVPTADMKPWLTVIDGMLARGWTDPEQFIAAQARSGALLPYANQLACEKAMQRYERFIATVDESLQARFNAEAMSWGYAVDITMSVRAGRTQEQAERLVVVNLQFPEISPLFRYGIAFAKGYTDAAERLHDAALEQLLTNPLGYAKAWAGKIPPTLLEEALEQVVVKL